VTGVYGGRQMSPRFLEWFMGLAAGWVTDVQGLSVAEMIEALGNGVVPQQAELALRYLLELSSIETEAEVAAPA
jgi:DNA (cytosine-5)-methyltransferase 1